LLKLIKVFSNSLICLIRLFIEIFAIDIQKIKIGKCESKEKLRNFSEDEIFKLMTRLRKIVDAENLDKKDLMNCLKELKIQLK